MILTRRRSYAFYFFFSFISVVIAASFFIQLLLDDVQTKNTTLRNDSYLLGEWIFDSFESTEYLLLNIIKVLPPDGLVYPPPSYPEYLEHKNRIDEIVSVFPHAAFYGVINNDGILSHSNSVDGFDLSDTEFFMRMKYNPYVKEVLSNAFISPEGYYYIIHGYKLIDENNKFTGMVVIGVSLSFFSEWISNLDYTGSGRILIADENGTVLASNSDETQLKVHRLDDRMKKTISDFDSNFEILNHRDPDCGRMVSVVRRIHDLPFFVIIEEESSGSTSLIFPLVMIGSGTVLALLLGWFILRSHLYQIELNRELAETGSELKTIFDHSMVGIILLDGDRRIVQANKRFIEMAGYQSAEAAIGHSISEIHISEEEYRRLGALNLKSFLESGSAQFEAEFKRIDGRIVWARVFGKTMDTSTPPDPTKGIIWIVDDITERREAKKILMEMATKDELTGLNNRRNFLELGEREYSNFLRHRRPLSVLMMDLDFFKDVNDTYGHRSGDKALIRFASVCTMNLRTGDISGRLGGEEFAVILPDTDIGKAVEVAERIRKKTEKAVIACDGVHYNITVSIGVAPAQSNQDLAKTLNRADSAMYESKKAGRNKVTVYSADKSTV